MIRAHALLGLRVVGMHVIILYTTRDNRSARIATGFTCADIVWFMGKKKREKTEVIPFDRRQSAGAFLYTRRTYTMRVVRLCNGKTRKLYWTDSDRMFERIKSLAVYDVPGVNIWFLFSSSFARRQNRQILRDVIPYTRVCTSEW